MKTKNALNFICNNVSKSDFLTLNNFLKNIENFTIKRDKNNQKLLIEYQHAVSTLYWLLKIESEPCLGLMLAAVGHDIERFDPNFTRIKRIDFSDHNSFKQQHQQSSAVILEKRLIEQNLNPNIINIAVRAVKNHEFSICENSYLIMAADSLAFLEQHWQIYCEQKKLTQAGIKLSFMYFRLKPIHQKIAMNIIKNAAKKNNLAAPFYIFALNYLKNTTKIKHAFQP